MVEDDEEKNPRAERVLFSVESAWNYPLLGEKKKGEREKIGAFLFYQSPCFPSRHIYTHWSQIYFYSLFFDMFFPSLLTLSISHLFLLRLCRLSKFVAVKNEKNVGKLFWH